MVALGGVDRGCRGSHLVTAGTAARRSPRDRLLDQASARPSISPSVAGSSP